MMNSNFPCSRRRFIEGIAAAAAAAALPFRLDGAPAFKPVWLNQYTYVVDDMKRTADWYGEVFGMQNAGTEGRETHLWFGDLGGDTLLRIRQAQAGENSPALTRFGFTINYWDRGAVAAELRRRGIEAQADTDKGFWFRDPDGNEIGLFAADYMTRPRTSMSAPEVWQALSANHIVVTSRDYRKLADWYHDLIALNETTDSGRDVVQWFGDTAWLPTQVRPDRTPSAELGTLDHCALTVADFEPQAVGREMKRFQMIPRDREIEADDTGIYGVDLNGFRVQVCAWNEAPNQDRRRRERARRSGG